MMTIRSQNGMAKRFSCQGTDKGILCTAFEFFLHRLTGYIESAKWYLVINLLSKMVLAEKIAIAYTVTNF